jgi:hypothetical protein
MKYKTYLNFVLTTALILVTLPSCSFHSTVNDDFPEVNLPADEMNKVIQIEDLPEFRNSYKNNDFLRLHVKNISSKTIDFQFNTCLLMFTKSEENWLPIANSMHYPFETRALHPTTVAPPGMIIDIIPSIPDMLEKQSIRIIIIGYYENADSQLVGAYLDVIIYP